MKLKCMVVAAALMSCGSLFAQNATKEDLNKLANQVNALSQKVSQLETNLERVITENVNLVEQLNVKTVTSMTDKNGIQWDIVKVEPSDNEVKITFRINNNTGVAIDLFCFAKEHGDESFAIDTNSNQDNNKYVFGDRFATVVPHGNPVNVFLTLKKVPITTSYLGYIQFSYNIGSKGTIVKFTGVHIPR